jgi:phospholipid/cholesterol/gamma-HCH transport system permease protein
MFVEVGHAGAQVELELTGEWRALQIGEIERALAAIELPAGKPVRIGTQHLRALDLTGAWALREFMRRARGGGSEVTFAGAPPDQLRLLDELQASAAAALAGQPALPEHTGLLASIGRHAVRAGTDTVDGLGFLGRASITFLRSLTSLRRLRLISVARHVYDAGLTAVPIVALIGFLISVIIAYMSAQQLRGLGADIYVVDLVAIGVLRELGVLLTSIIVAGRSGSAFAAELGSMKLNEEVDALTATGVDPFEVLVVPRLLGLAIALPLLTIVADLVGLAGGALLCRYLLDMPLTQFVGRVNYAISPSTFWVGLLKAPVFAVLIGLCGCYRGMLVRDSARELGRLVTVAVVQAIFFVILADALFAVLFMQMDI